MSLLDRLIVSLCVSDGLLSTYAFLHCNGTVKFYYAMTCSSTSFLARIIQWLFSTLIVCKDVVT